MGKKESRTLSLSSLETSNIDNIVYSKTASLKQGRVHWWFSKFLGEWQTRHSEKIDFIASQVCYQRVLLSIERAANASRQSQHCSGEGIVFKLSEIAGDSGKHVASL